MMPFVLLMLWRRGAKEPLYKAFWGERFGLVHCKLDRPIWVHPASMGEMRGAAPWIQALLDQGFTVFLTTLTPAGRLTAQKLFAEALSKGQLQLSYTPFELSWAVKGFLRRVKPRCGVMTEIDTWPVLLATASKVGLPLAMANAQYPKESFERDQRWGKFRARLFQAYSLVMCKSDLQAQRFTHVGCPRVVVAGETRFDLPISSHHVAAAELVRTRDLPGRTVVCLASIIEVEEDLIINTIKRVQQAFNKTTQASPLFVFVPRSPQRFEAVVEQTIEHGLQTASRSQVFDAKLQAMSPINWNKTDVLVGDSIGEMYFYLALSQVVVVGSSFGQRAVHNIIEPLAVKKPVWTGPSIRGIEYPAIEALEAGVLHHASSGDDLANQLIATLSDPTAYTELVEKTEHFNAAHAGSVDKHMAAFLPWLKSQGAA